jgi:hypothetical protein
MPTQGIIAARQNPGFRDEPAQLGPQSSDCLAHRQLSVAEQERMMLESRTS